MMGRGKTEEYLPQIDKGRGERDDGNTTCSFKLQVTKTNTKI